MEITGDKGGKQIIKRYPEDVTYLKISDEGTAGCRCTVVISFDRNAATVG